MVSVFAAETSLVIQEVDKHDSGLCQKDWPQIDNSNLNDLV